MKPILFTLLLLCIVVCGCATDENGSNEESSSSKDNSISSSDSSSESSEGCVAGVSGDTLTDGRDCKKYRIVKIGDLTWMAENLNYVRNINEDDNYLDLSYFLSECFDGEDSNCEKYGRLYDWDEFGFFCPEGWHIPSAHDWENLIIATGDPYTSGKKLKSTTDWIEGGNGTDEFGFTALPGGSSSVWLPGEIGVWWSSETEDESNAFGYAMHFYYYSDSFEFSINHKARGTSVRCVKDL